MSVMPTPVQRRFNQGSGPWYRSDSRGPSAPLLDDEPRHVDIFAAAARAVFEQEVMHQQHDAAWAHGGFAVVVAGTITAGNEQRCYLFHDGLFARQRRIGDRRRPLGRHPLYVPPKSIEAESLLQRLGEASAGLARLDVGAGPRSRVPVGVVACFASGALVFVFGFLLVFR